MIQHSVLLEIERQEGKLAMDQHKEKTNSNKVKSSVKRKSKFTNRRSRENDMKRKKFMLDNFGEDENEQLKKCVRTWRKKKKYIKKKRITKETEQSVITITIIKKISYENMKKG